MGNRKLQLVPEKVSSPGGLRDIHARVSGRRRHLAQ